MFIVEFLPLLNTLMSEEVKRITINFVTSNPECTKDNLIF